MISIFALFYKNLALSYFYQDNDQGISYFQELLERYPYDYEIMDAYFRVFINKITYKN